MYQSTTILETYWLLNQMSVLSNSIMHTLYSYWSVILSFISSFCFLSTATVLDSVNCLYDFGNMILLTTQLRNNEA